jgi:predicted enzyme related to lactoylglutathione lyase
MITEARHEYNPTRGWRRRRGKTVKAEGVEAKIEVVVVPVSDVGRAKAFYFQLGWRVDADVDKDGLQLVQLTPPGSACSIQFGSGLTSAAPGSAQDTYLVVADLEKARQDLLARGVDVSEPFHEHSLGGRFHPPGAPDRAEGPSPDAKSYGSFASFSDPDGNVWLIQEITSRLPDRVDAEAVYTSVDALSAALRRAAAAHGEHEKRIGRADPDWPDWYAAYMSAEATGTELPV